jgi:hypothetical protein
MASGSAANLEACWKALASAMLRECERRNHHFRCPAGEARFQWLIKHSMFASVDEFPRLVISKGASRPQEKERVFFATHFYAQEGCAPEDSFLSIDSQMMCSLGEVELRMTIAEMCSQFFDKLCKTSTSQ